MKTPYTYAENMICRFYSNYQRQHTYLCSIDFSSQKEENKSSMFSASECRNMATRHKQAKETTGVGFRSVKEGFLIGTVMMKGHSSDIKWRTGWLRTIGRGQREKKSQKVAKDQKSNKVMRKRDEREITAPPEIALGKEKVEGWWKGEVEVRIVEFSRIVWEFGGRGWRSCLWFGVV